jgi:uncharacterized membrane protein
MVDAWRGLAIAGVVLFHFVWDLEFTGFISGVAYHPLWLGFGRVLAGSFMMLVGISLALSSRSPFRPSAYLRRLAKIGVAAAAITLVTWYAFPATFIYFGILHAIAVATLVGTLFQRTPWWLSLAFGLAMLAAPSLWQSELFDTRWLADLPVGWHYFHRYVRRKSSGRQRERIRARPPRAGRSARQRAGLYGPAQFDNLPAAPADHVGHHYTAC